MSAANNPDLQLPPLTDTLQKLSVFSSAQQPAVFTPGMNIEHFPLQRDCGSVLQEEAVLSRDIDVYIKLK